MRSSVCRRSTYHAVRLLVASLVVATGATMFAAAPAKFTSNGKFVSVYATDASGCIAIYVSASRAVSSGGQPQTYLEYSVYDQCAETSVGWGYGLIPEADLVFKGKTATLKTTPRASDTFALGGATGVISLTARANGVYSTTVTGQARTKFPGGESRSKGTWTYTSATLAGTALGADLFSVSAQIGSNRERDMEMIRT